MVLECRHFPGQRFLLKVLCRLFGKETSAQKWYRSDREKSERLIEILQNREPHC